jgi:hypothetical protein
MEKKFVNICFCCLTEEGLLKDMLNEMFRTIDFVECYTVCSGIVPDYASTKNICSTCEEKLKSSYQFRELCRQSYQTLKDKTEFVPNLYVNVKHEVASDNENDFVYDSSSKKVGKNLKTRQFTQVYVRDLNEEPLKTSAPVTNAPTQPETASKKAAVDEILLKAEDDVEEDDIKEDIPKKAKPTRSVKRRGVKVVKSVRKAKVTKEKPTQKLPHPDLDVEDMESKFTCYHCEIPSRTYNEFLQHRNTAHKVGNKFQSYKRICLLCNTEVKNFVEHISDIHKDYRPCICSYCKKGRYQTPLELRSHLNRHLINKAAHECLSCTEKFSKRAFFS